MISIKKLVEPFSTDEDMKRKEYIFNILVVGSLALAIASFIRIIIDIYFLLNNVSTSTFIIISFIILILLALYTASRKGYFIFSSYILIFILVLSAVYTSYKWGIDVPQSLLIYALTIIMSGILISTRFAFLEMALIALILMALTWLQREGFIKPNTYWIEEELTQYGDTLVYLFTLLTITLVSWLSNREIERALKRARQSEAELKNERDMLEVKIEERTAELKNTQQEKMLQFNHFAEVGRSTAGILHDIVNPLTYLSLNLDKLYKDSQTFDPSPYSEIKQTVERAISGTKKLQNFTGVILKQLKRQDAYEKYDIIQEIKQTIEMLSYKAKCSHVVIGFNPRQINIPNSGNPAKFNQLTSNLICNSIDSYEGMDIPEKIVFVRVDETDGLVVLEVEDKGSGIEEQHHAKVFEPFFTTKNIEQGTGLGLSNSKFVVENELKGRISFTSRKGDGTCFRVEFPLAK
jgi:C4-dicarboxylate-specific signal transduction histidine kinase